MGISIFLNQKYAIVSNIEISRLQCIEQINYIGMYLFCSICCTPATAIDFTTISFEVSCRSNYINIEFAKTQII